MCNIKLLLTKDVFFEVKVTGRYQIVLWKEEEFKTILNVSFFKYLHLKCHSFKSLIWKLFKICNEFFKTKNFKTTQIYDIVIKNIQKSCLVLWNHITTSADKSCNMYRQVLQLTRQLYNEFNKFVKYIAISCGGKTVLSICF